MIASSTNKSQQKTIKNEINFIGIGLHSGIHANVKITSFNRNNLFGLHKSNNVKAA